MSDFTHNTFGEGASSQATGPAAAGDQGMLDAYSTAVIGVTERVGPAVVRVETGPKMPNARERGGLGLGIGISPDGLVLTNSHVVGSSKQIRLRDNEGAIQNKTTNAYAIEIMMSIIPPSVDVACRIRSKVAAREGGTLPICANIGRGLRGPRP